MNRLFFLLIILILVSCTGKKKEIVIPEEVISVDTMKMLLVDFHIIEAAMFDRYVGKEGDEDSISQYYADAMAKYSVTREKFNESMFFYCQNPEIFQNIYAEVVVELNKKQSEVQKLSPK